MSTMKRLGQAGGVTAVLALLMLWGYQGDVHWCPIPDGAVVEGGTIDPEHPWILADGQETLVCEVGGVKYNWKTCSIEGGCSGGEYAERVMCYGNGDCYAQ